MTFNAICVEFCFAPVFGAVKPAFIVMITFLYFYVYFVYDTIINININNILRFPRKVNIGIWARLVSKI